MCSLENIFTDKSRGLLYFRGQICDISSYLTELWNFEHAGFGQEAIKGPRGSKCNVYLFLPLSIFLELIAII